MSSTAETHFEGDEEVYGAVRSNPNKKSFDPAELVNLIVPSKYTFEDLPQFEFYHFLL